MDTAEDEDLRLQRAAPGLLSDLQTLLDRLIWRPSSNGGVRQVRSSVKRRDIDDRIIPLIEPFQEDPQILDSQLKHLVPPLVDAYLEYLLRPVEPRLSEQSVTLSYAICRILNTFCKVRGEKIIRGFLNNEPRYLELVLAALEQGIRPTDEAKSSMIWEERYILLLWLSHLMLAPFDLASISSDKPSLKAVLNSGIKPPPELPGIAIRVLPICTRYLNAATKERNAASALLVRLCLRPDMQKLGLLNSVVRWTLQSFEASSNQSLDIHHSLGLLSFVSGLVASANNQELSTFVSSIYKSCQQIVGQNSSSYVQSSAVARKLVIKTLRNIVVHCLQTSSPVLDTDTVLEDAIDLLLQSVGDGDTPVRYAASKALSVITMKLDTAMGEEVVEAILGSLNEDVFWQGSNRSLSAVNPLKWHGLTLTLGHLLYRRAISIGQLPDVLNALLLALTFEQRSTTGASVGTNVRDAACFGIWALSRRYITKELLSIQTESIRAATGHNNALSIPQVLAIELLAAACLDPAGNIRRGSSAALQELIGRHPDTVLEGIPLVQTVDFHAVGLRDRAICEVGIKASRLGQIYWDALFDGLLGWRGVGAADVASRLSTARAIGLLSALQPKNVVDSMISIISSKLKKLACREVEERHGLLISLASIITQLTQLHHILTPASHSNATDIPVQLTSEDTLRLARLWKIIDGLNLKDSDFVLASLRPELTSVAICTAISALASQTLLASDDSAASYNPGTKEFETLLRYLNLCLGRSEDSVLEAIPMAVKQTSLLVGAERRESMVSSWLIEYQHTSQHLVSRKSGYIVALGAAYSTIGSDNKHQNDIVDTLTHCITPAFGINERVIALKSLQLIFEAVNHTSSTDTDIIAKIVASLDTSLNDYTINERGDVGSLLRLEALNAMEAAWKRGLLENADGEQQLRAAVMRLSLEKLDKVRTRAARCLEGETATASTPADVSSHAYFAHKLALLTSTTAPSMASAILEGYVSSAGMGSESVVQASRLALVDALDALPATAEGDAYALLDVANTLVLLLKEKLAVDRVVSPLLEVIAFLFDAQVLQRLVGTEFKWRNLLSLVQKAHFKSNNMHKLHIALDVYRGIAEVEAVRPEVLKKVSSMLLHPYPKIRIAAAETLFMATGDDELKHHDWSQSTKVLKGVVEGISRRWSKPSG